jgi:ribonuclease VapC
LILDTSAIVAIALREPGREQLLKKIGAAGDVGVGAPTLAETSIVLASRLGDSAPQWLERLVERTGTIVISFEREHWQRAAEAWLRFGRGRHAAALNLGDCYSYATAKVAARPLLCTGHDFPQTDLTLA